MFNYLPHITRRFLRTRVRSLLRPPPPPPPPPPPEAAANVAAAPISPATAAATAAPEVPVTPEPVTYKPPPTPASKTVPEGLTAYAYRWETTAPTESQLRAADDFFTKYPAKYLWSEAKFKKIDYGSSPEVVFLGRSNVGKSTLLNALLGHKGMAYTSSKPGRTKLLSAFAINQGKAVLLDMPGYGHASREDWGIQVMKYLHSRKQFRRAFILIDAVHGAKPSDLLLLEHLGREGISFQIVLSKIDKLNPKNGSVQRAFEDVRYLLDIGAAGVSGLGEVLAVAGQPARRNTKRIGISELRWSVLVACGLDMGIKR